MSDTKMSDGDDHDTRIGADPTAINRGHEEDVTDIRSIWAIPIAVVAFIVLGLVVATGSFIYLMNRAVDPTANERAVARGQAPLNERMARIGRAGQGTELTDQPRLEGLKQLEGDGQTTSRPELPNVNPPQYPNEMLRPENQKLLKRAGWIKTGEFARIPITDAIQIMLHDHMFPVRKDPVKLTSPEFGATGANAGRGVPTIPTTPAPKKDH